MSDLLNNLEEGFERRIALRRRMLKHLGLTFTDDQAARLYPDIRRTVLACIDCPNPDACQGWLDQGRRNVPMFCKGRESLLRLDAELKLIAEARAETEAAPPEAPARKHSVNG